MADFCMQCSIDHFGEDYKDMDMHWRLEELRKTGTTLPPAGERVWPALCEGCGPTVVDDDGRCVHWCALNHVPKPEEQRDKV